MGRLEGGAGRGRAAAARGMEAGGARLAAAAGRPRRHSGRRTTLSGDDRADAAPRRTGGRRSPRPAGPAPRTLRAPPSIDPRLHALHPHVNTPPAAPRRAACPR
ncbi:unnamed protein product [Danaus chrysippus]|uniref:(African queen) hypothetical protein n=1 Tax=Danaus chrysippus TaxID=151541 RepID=A0A8J2W087_9NEOP|nr:unnamed protein product [Danaus chrysippus]